MVYLKVFPTAFSVLLKNMDSFTFTFSNVISCMIYTVLPLGFQLATAEGCHQDFFFQGKEARKFAYIFNV
jgi:uncharacterized membrane protein YfhO